MVVRGWGRVDRFRAVRSATELCETGSRSDMKGCGGGAIEPAHPPLPTSLPS